MTAPVTTDGGLSLRNQLSSLHALLVLSMLMTESGDEDQIVHLARTSVPSLVPCLVEDLVLFDDPGGVNGQALGNGGTGAEAGPARLSRAADAGGRLHLSGRAWAWAYPLRGLSGQVGNLVVSSDAEPASDAQFLLRVLTQQTGVAIANARAHRREQEARRALVEANTRLEDTVAVLRRTMGIHERFTRVAVGGGGLDGIAAALHEATGLPVALEDRYGNLRSWAGPNRPDPYPKDPAARREQLLRRLLLEGHPVRDGGRLVAIASPRSDVVGVLALIDPARAAGAADLVALEYGATVLAMELARLRSIAEAELRLRRDLLEDLLSGTSEQDALERGEALGHDLAQPHRVVLIEGHGRSREDDVFLHAIRRAARDLDLGKLLVRRAGSVVLLTCHELDWSRLHARVLQELGGGRCRIAVGGLAGGPSEVPRSYREAQLAMNLQRSANRADAVVSFEDLGVYRVLSSISEPAEVEQFVRQWLSGLLDYDQRRKADLFNTLAVYLECGGSYDESAARLHVHRSTLKYRLQRIREISRLDITDPDTAFNLQLACRTWRILQALRAAPQ